MTARSTHPDSGRPIHYDETLKDWVYTDTGENAELPEGPPVDYQQNLGRVGRGTIGVLLEISRLAKSPPPHGDMEGTQRWLLSMISNFRQLAPQTESKIDDDALKVAKEVVESDAFPAIFALYEAIFDGEYSTAKAAGAEEGPEDDLLGGRRNGRKMRKLLRDEFGCSKPKFRRTVIRLWLDDDSFFDQPENDQATQIIERLTGKTARALCRQNNLEEDDWLEVIRQILEMLMEFLPIFMAMF